MQVLITGANGFIGKNLRAHLSERKEIVITLFTKENLLTDLSRLVKEADFIFHLAGVNRPKHDNEFQEGNVDLTRTLYESVLMVYQETGKRIPVVYSSSTQVALSNSYGVTKKAAEEILLHLADYNIPVYIMRLTNVFGKWCRPNYNSVVATFCNNIARNLPIEIRDRSARVELVYIDDVIDRFLEIISLTDHSKTDNLETIQPIYSCTVGELADLIQAIKKSRESMVVERVGTGFARALHATYLSYLPTETFSYSLLQHPDARGNFVEMLKTKDSGQFSFFTAKPGITRGGHYHHSKTEKFLVIKGKAKYRFENIITGELFELEKTGELPEIVETIPGWAHDITNIGDDDLIVMLWANEIFSKDKPDTYYFPLHTSA